MVAFVWTVLGLGYGVMVTKRQLAQIGRLDMHHDLQEEPMGIMW